MLLWAPSGLGEWGEEVQLFSECGGVGGSEDFSKYGGYRDLNWIYN